MEGVVGRSGVASGVAPPTLQCRPLHRRVVVLFAALLALLGGLVTAPAYADPNPWTDWPQVAAPGDALAVTINMYRYRHTVSPSSPILKWETNVAAFPFQYNGKDMVIVTNSIGRFPNNPKIAYIDCYRRNPETGEWMLVDEEGNPLGDWRTARRPVVRWDLSEETDPDLVKELRSGLHSERVASFYLKLKMKQANITTTEGLSERIPCESIGNMCRKNLYEQNWFPKLTNMRYLTRRGQSSEEVKAGTDAPSALRNGYQRWEAAGMPIGLNAKVRMITANLFSTPDSFNPGGVLATGLAAGTNPGGIDFSTLQLRYLSEGSGGQLQYAFDASTGTGGKTADGQVAAAQSSDAFFVWLSLPPSTFWVNLNPTESDRIVDAKLGTTDVGRILLQADLNMKKMSAKLTNPNTDLGQQFWGPPDPNALQECVVTRQWIVPKPASVYEADGGIYIIDAPLEVKAESEMNKGVFGDPSCPAPSDRMEKVFEQLILPKVEDAVNHASEFAELRRVYLARVAAEWYRQKHSRGGLLSSLIDSNDVSAWPALQIWSPHQVFDDYVKSYRDHEYNVTKTVDSGNYRYTFSYSDGGVDFGKVPFAVVPKNTFQQQHPGASQAVQRSYQQPTQDGSGTLLLGGTSHPVLPGNLNDPAMAVPMATSRPSFWYVAATPLVLWLLAGAVLVVRRRRSGAESA